MGCEGCRDGSCRSGRYIHLCASRCGAVGTQTKSCWIRGRGQRLQSRCEARDARRSPLLQSRQRGAAKVQASCERRKADCGGWEGSRRTHERALLEPAKETQFKVSRGLKK